MRYRVLQYSASVACCEASLLSVNLPTFPSQTHTHTHTTATTHEELPRLPRGEGRLGPPSPTGHTPVRIYLVFRPYLLRSSFSSGTLNFLGRESSIICQVQVCVCRLRMRNKVCNIQRPQSCCLKSFAVCANDFTFYVALSHSVTLGIVLTLHYSQ